jgi:hypothetical protein
MYLLPFIKGGLTMKKLFKHLTFALLLGSLGFGLAQRNKDVVRADAASPTTKRVWMKNSITSTWDADGAGTAIHYWGGAQGTTWPGVRVKWDPANSLVYFDLPADITHFMFVRVSGSGPILDWGAKTEDLIYSESVGKYFDLTGPIAWDGAKTPGSFKTFTPVTTTAVSAFAATIDTDAEACSVEAAQTAIDTYNNLPTFEQNQYAALDVGGGKTGMDRLKYLKAFYNINTSIGSSVSGRIPSSDNSATATLIISALGVSSLAGYYFISKKKLFG